jgi:hypothetical protein
MADPPGLPPNIPKRKGDWLKVSGEDPWKVFVRANQHFTTEQISAEFHYAKSTVSNYKERVKNDMGFGSMPEARRAWLRDFDGDIWGMSEAA